MLFHWILMCLAVVALVQWSGTKVYAKEELDEVEKELVRALENALENQGKSNLNTMSQRDDDDDDDDDDNDPCEEECADISDDSTVREVGECMACLCGVDPSSDICDDDDDDDKRGQPENIVRKMHLAKKGWLPRIPIPRIPIPRIPIPRIPAPRIPSPSRWWRKK